MKVQKAKNWKMEPGPGQLNLLCKNANFTGFLATCGGGAHKLAIKKPKCKKRKAQKAKMKGNEGPKGQNEKK